MANQLFNGGREGFLNGTVSWGTSPIIMALWGTLLTTTWAATAYPANFSSATATYGATPLGTAQLSGMAFGSGIASASDTTATAVTTSSTAVTAITLHANQVIGGSPMIAFIDTAASGLPITPNGGNITVSWSRGSNAIFKL